MTNHVELFYDHYKDTFGQVKEYLSKRDVFFVRAALLLACSLFTTQNPLYVTEVTESVGRVKLGMDLGPAFSTLDAVLGFLFLWYLIRYYQAVLIVENLYRYVHKLEETLSSAMTEYQISREGKSYLSSYPLLKTCLHWFYSLVFPTFVVLGTALRLYWQVTAVKEIVPVGTVIVDTVCALTVILLTFLYVSWVHFHDFRRHGKSSELL